MAGSAILRKLQQEGFANLIVRKSSELDLTDQAAVKEFFIAEQPAYVFLVAAKVGGILAVIIFGMDDESPYFGME